MSLNRRKGIKKSPETVRHAEIPENEIVLQYPEHLNTWKFYYNMLSFEVVEAKGSADPHITICAVASKKLAAASRKLVSQDEHETVKNGKELTVYEERLGARPVLGSRSMDLCVDDT